MSYKSESIKRVIDDIDQRKIYLPALQRKFVWGKHQIELLFDSLMRNYPIGTFLFWRLKKTTAESYVFYEFLTKYDQRHPYNDRKTGAFSYDEIIGVLDGQQRLSSMCIGLRGTHTEGYRRKWSRKEPSYEETRLYINLLSLPYKLDANNRIQAREDKNFEFRFLTEATARSSALRKVTADDGTPHGEEPMFWMKVGDVLSWEDDPEFSLMIDDFAAACTGERQRSAIHEQKRFITKFLETLRDRIRRESLINYFEVAKDDLEDILKIFVRVNSAGTVLNRTDLLFSTIVATWNDGREQIEALLKEINGKGDRFSFNNEFLMRCCLVLSDAPVAYKVNSFKAENVQKIRDEWPKIADAIRRTVDLLAEFGFNGSLLTSQAATIIIAYHLHKGGLLDEASKQGIRKYLVHALLKGIYGGSQDHVISTLRNTLRQEVRTQEGFVDYKLRNRSFDFDELLKTRLSQHKSLTVTEADLEQFLFSRKGPVSFFVLSLLYPQLRYNEVVFHQDHMHPAARFTDENFRAMEIPEDQWQEWRSRRDCVPNLQLLMGRENIVKNATPLQDWVRRMSEAERIAFLGGNYFPPEVSLEFREFMSFFEQRKEILREELRRGLAVSGEAAVAVSTSGSEDEAEISELDPLETEDDE